MSFSPAPLFTKLDAQADGDNTIIAGVAGKQIRVLGYHLMATGAGTVIFKDAIDFRAYFSLAANGAATYAGTHDAPAFDCAVGQALTVTNPAGVDTKGHITYVLF